MELACRWGLDSIDDTESVCHIVLPHYVDGLEMRWDSHIRSVERAEAQYAFRGLTVASIVERLHR